jgi:hypothetical protein
MSVALVVDDFIDSLQNWTNQGLHNVRQRERQRLGEGRELGSPMALESDGEVCRSAGLRQAISLQPCDDLGASKGKRETGHGAFIGARVAWRRG